MAHHSEDPTVVHPEVFTLHWEGPPHAVLPGDVRFPASREERSSSQAAERARELQELRRTERGRQLWREIRSEALRRGDEGLWRRKLHAYWWVKLRVLGTANDYARRFELNHATVRSWISEVAKLAYQVGYRLHEDKLMLVGEAPPGLDRLRKLVNADAASEEAMRALRDAEAGFRGEDPYFHLNEGHVLRAHGRLRDSDATLCEGLTIAEARPVRSLLWNARGQTFWDCVPGSSHPLEDHLERAERAFRRAAALDRSTYFAFVNLVQMAVDAGDLKRADYWVGELGAARKRMSEQMQQNLARYLHEVEWTRPVEPRRFWRSGPLRWIQEAFRKGVLPLLVAAALLLGPAPTPARADLGSDAVDIVANGGSGGGRNKGGAGGN